MNGFNTDILADNPIWENLFGLVTEVNDDLILKYVRELSQIRKIDTDSDKEVVAESVRNLGVNLSKDLYALNADRFAQIFHSLPDYGDMCNTRDWSKYVSFLLGYKFETRRLYTADYAMFVPVPLGTLVIDGGKWYKTTHVEMEVDSQLIEAGLDLRITAADKEQVLSILTSAMRFSEQEALAWFDNHLGVESNNDDEVQRAIRVSVFWRRMEELFYQWAPIEEVLHHVWVSIETHLTIRIGSTIALEPMRYVESSYREIVSSDFTYPTSVNGAQIISIGHHVVYSDGSESTVGAVATSDYLTYVGEGTYAVKDVDYVMDVFVELTGGSDSKRIVMRIYPQHVQIEPQAIRIEAPAALYGSKSYTFLCIGQYAHLSAEIDMASGCLTWSSSFGEFDGNILKLPHMDSDLDIEVTCKYTGDLVRTLSVVLPAHKSINEKVPIQLTLVGNTSITQSEVHNLVCLCTYNDGTTEQVTALLKSSTPMLVLNRGQMCGLKSSLPYSAIVSAQYQENGRVVSDNLMVTVMPKKLKIGKMRISMPTVYEKDTIRPVLSCLWVDLSATQGQIDAEDPSIVYGWVETNAAWRSVGIDGNTVNIDADTGEFQAPVLDVTSDFCICASVVTDTVETITHVFKVHNRDLSPEYLDLVISDTLSSGSRIPLRTDILWSSGSRTTGAATYTVVYEPYDSAKTEAKARTTELIAALAEAGKDYSHLNPLDPDYSQWVTLSVVPLADTGYDAILDLNYTRQALYFAGDLHGSARLTARYEYEGVVKEQNITIPLVPIRSLVTDLVIEAQEYIREDSRTFLRAKATMSDGTEAYVNADWSAYWDQLDEEDEYPMLSFVNGEYSGMKIVELIEGTIPDNMLTFQSLAISKWSMFSNISSISDLEDTVYVGTILAVRRIPDSQVVAELKAHYYRNIAKKDVVLLMREPQPIDKIVLSQILGPVEFPADFEYVGYALMNTYKIPAELNTTGKDILYDLEVSSEWAILKTEVLDDHGVWVETADALAVISDSGYLSPTANKTARFTIQTTFTDGIITFTRSLEVVMSKVNEYLSQMLIQGPNTVYDDVTKNVDVQYVQGLWYLQYGVRVILADNSELIPESCKWSIVGQLESVVFDTSTGRLYVTDRLKSDETVTLVAEYTADTGTGVYETVRATLQVNVLSATAVVSAYIVNPRQVLPDMNIQLEARYTRRNGIEASSLHPDLTARCSWYLEDNATSATITPDGILRFASSASTQTVTVRCSVTEGSTHIVEGLDVTCTGVGFPTRLTVSGPKNIRDDSKVYLAVQCSRQQMPSTTETANCLYTLVDAEGNETTVRGVTVDLNTGALTVGKLVQDTNIRVRVLFLESSFRLIEYYSLTAYSSYPMYGSAAFGVNTVTEVLASLDSHMNSAEGGQMVLDAKEGQFGYFCCREDYGTPVFTAVSDSKGQINSNWLGWDGAKWPITGISSETGPIVLERVFDNVTDRLRLYRTNARAFGFALISVRYQS